MGDASVGKFKLLLHYSHGQFREENQLTIGVEFGWIFQDSWRWAANASSSSQQSYLCHGDCWEGGAWGIALLASYTVNNPNKMNLAEYLENIVFAGNTGVSIAPTAEDMAGFEKYIENYKRCLLIEQSAIDNK